MKNSDIEKIGRGEHVFVRIKAVGVVVGYQYESDRHRGLCVERLQVMFDGIDRPIDVDASALRVVKEPLPKASPLKFRLRKPNKGRAKR